MHGQRQQYVTCEVLTKRTHPIWNDIPLNVNFASLEKKPSKRKLNDFLQKFLLIEEMNVDMRFIDLSMYTGFL